MKNKLGDLHNHLFEQIERLNDEDLKDEALAQEIARGNAMVNIAAQIIQNGKLALDAMKQEDNFFNQKLPPMLTAADSYSKNQESEKQ